MTALALNQRRILLCLALGAMAERTGSDIETAEAHMDRYCLDIRGDAQEVTASVAGQILIRVSRAWLDEIAGDAA